MAKCDRFDASIQCKTDEGFSQSSGATLSESALDFLKEGLTFGSKSLPDSSKIDSEYGKEPDKKPALGSALGKVLDDKQSFDGNVLNFDPTKPIVQADVSPEQELALGRLREGKQTASLPSKTAIEAGTKEAAATGQPELQKVSWEDNRTADLLGHDLWLLAGVTSAPATFAQNVLKEFSTMPEEKLNLVADLLEKGAHHAAVKRDANGKVESISYNYDHIRLKEIFDHGITPGLIVLPDALMMKAGRALNRGSGSDVTINFKNGETTLEARQYWDITGKGYFGGGSHRMSKPIQRANPIEYKPYWMRDA